MIAPYPQTIIDVLERSPEIVIPLVREIRTENLGRRPKPEKWSAHEHIAHLACVDPVFIARLDAMLSENQPAIVPYDPDKESGRVDLLGMDLEESIRKYAEQRKGLVARLRALAPGDWERTARHPEYAKYSVFIMFRHLAMHDLLHGYRIEELALNKEWK